MNIVADAKVQMSDLLAIRSMRRHRSRLGWRLAPAYTRYWRRCQSAFRGEVAGSAVTGAVETFRRDGVASFSTPESQSIAASMYGKIVQREAANEDVWTAELGESGNLNYKGDVWRDFPEIENLFTGPLGAFLTGYFHSHFKIFYGTLYKSIGTGARPGGSQRWHSDGGPGSCVNVMFYLHATDGESGALQALPWPVSLAIYERERKALRAARAALPPGATKVQLRELISDFYERVIAEEYANQVRQPTGPAGLVVPFLNNDLHRGGNPAPGRARYAVVFHCYPSDRPADFARYRNEGIAKTASYPKDPAVEF